MKYTLRPFCVPALMALLLMGFAAAPAQASEIFEILERNEAEGLLTPPDHVPYRHTVDIILTEAEGDNVSEVTARLRIDPSRAPGERVTIIETDAPADDKILADFIADIESEENTPVHQAENFWCQAGGGEDGHDDISRSDFVILEETETMARLRPSAEATAQLMTMAVSGEASDSEAKMIRRLIKRLEADITFDKPSGRVRQVRLRMTRPMRVMLVAKIKSMDMTQDCAPAPNGHMFAQSLYMHFGMSALGQEGRSDMQIKVSELELIAP